MAGKSKTKNLLQTITVPCRACPLRPMKTFREFSSEELRFVEKFKIAEARYAAGQTILIEGERSPYLYTVLSGWTIKYKMLEDGRRQIVNYALPGDLLGLQSAVLDKMHQSVEALSETNLCVFSKEKVWGLYREHHALGFDITWIAAQEKSILGEFLVSIGQRTATERIAFLLLTLFRRARAVGLVKENSVAFPFTQEHLADTIGFSLVHTNKRLRALSRLGVFDWRGQNFTMRDEAALAALVGGASAVPTSRPFI